MNLKRNNKEKPNKKKKKLTKYYLKTLKINNNPTSFSPFSFPYQGPRSYS